MGLLEHLYEPFCCIGLRALRFVFPLRVRGRVSAMLRITEHSAVRSAFAASDLTSVYQRANGVTAPGSPANSIVAFDSIWGSADWRRKSAASRRSQLPQIAKNATRGSKSRSPLGPASIKGSQPSRRSFFPAALTL